VAGTSTRLISIKVVLAVAFVKIILLYLQTLYTFTYQNNIYSHLYFYFLILFVIDFLLFDIDLLIDFFFFMKDLFDLLKNLFVRVLIR